MKPFGKMFFNELLVIGIRQLTAQRRDFFSQFFGFLLTQWGLTDSPANLDGVGGVDGSDVGVFFTNFGNTCP